MRARQQVAAGVAGVLLLTGCSGGGSQEPAPTPEDASGSSATAPTTPTPSGATAPTPTATPPAPPEPSLTAPVPASSGDEIGARLAAAEAVVRSPGSSEADRDQAAFEIQALARQLARRPGWRDAAIAAAGPHRADVADHVAARTALRSILASLSTTLPAWRIAEPAPVDELLGHYRRGERRFGVPWEVLAAVNLVETGFGRIIGYSSAGARGPMQFIAPTWAAYGRGDIDDPRDAILAAARYLAANGGASPSRLDGALHAYNRHDGYVRGVRAYARILERDPRALEVLHRWQITYLSARGDIWIPVGYDRTAPIAVDRYLRRHPERLLSTATD